MNNRSDPAEVRGLALTDLDALLALYSDIGLLAPESDRQRLAMTWEKILASDILRYTGVFVGKVLASTCHAVIVPNLSRGVRPYAILENVGTLSSHRRQGLGTLALRATIALCWEAGCYKVMLASSVANTGAHAFYAALGFDALAKQSFVLKRPGGS